MKDYKEQVATVLRRALKKAGKKKDLAAAVDVRPQTVTAWFAGVMPRGEMMERLMKYLSK